MIKNYLYSIFLIPFLIIGCKKSIKDKNVGIDALPLIIKIPVVVHVIYDEEKFNISDEKIHSQISVLNKDFNAKNDDLTKTPLIYRNLIADVGIVFELAKIDPNGKPTTGITRTKSIVNGWDGRTTAQQQTPFEELALYQTSKGGQDAWPTDRYLNIWVATLSNRTGDNISLAGYTQLPGKDPLTDGLVIDPRCFGTLIPNLPDYTLGHTATHEIGHWLNLSHVYENPTDFVDDTPMGDMQMNFMGYGFDNDICMFTIGQKNRMRAVFAEGGLRRKLYLNNN